MYKKGGNSQHSCYQLIKIKWIKPFYFIVYVISKSKMQKENCLKKCAHKYFIQTEHVSWLDFYPNKTNTRRSWFIKMPSVSFLAQTLFKNFACLQYYPKVPIQVALNYQLDVLALIFRERNIIQKLGLQ